MKPVGSFVPFVTQIQCVKRIPSKELNLNEGRPLIQPQPCPDEDLRGTMRLLTAAMDEVSEDAARFAARPLDGVGSYFAKASLGVGTDQGGHREK